MSASSVTVRAELCEALRLDLVGPDNDHAFARELLPEAPSRWYLTGFLVPRYAPEDQRVDAQADDELDADGDADGDDGSPRTDCRAQEPIPSSPIGARGPGVMSLNARSSGRLQLQGKPPNRMSPPRLRRKPPTATAAGPRGAAIVVSSRRIGHHRSIERRGQAD